MKVQRGGEEYNLYFLCVWTKQLWYKVHYSSSTQPWLYSPFFHPHTNLQISLLLLFLARYYVLCIWCYKFIYTQNQQHFPHSFHRPATTTHNFFQPPFPPLSFSTSTPSRFLCISNIIRTVFCVWYVDACVCVYVCV